MSDELDMVYPLDSDDISSPRKLATDGSLRAMISEKLNFRCFMGHRPSLTNKNLNERLPVLQSVACANVVRGKFDQQRYMGNSH